MATTTAPTRRNGPEAPGAVRPGVERPALAARRRQLPLVAVGVLLVVGCALAFADLSLRAGRGSEVLVVAQPVAAGQRVTAADLRAVKLSAPGGVATVPLSDEGAVLGRAAVVALSPGAVLTKADVGSGAGIGASSDVVAVALKPGAYPPDLAAGDRVQVVPVASASTGGVTATTPSTKSPIPATVLAVVPASPTSGSPAVISLEVQKSHADEVASLAAGGEVALVEVGGR